MSEQPVRMDRRGFFRGAAAATLGLAAGGAALRAARAELVWQIDPNACVQCGNCAEKCVLSPSAVKCVQEYEMCGYCGLCFGYHEPGAIALDTAAENQLCPTGAIERRFVEDPYFEYNIIEDLCIGCAICVRGCSVFGNGSFYLQVRHDRCVNCNECAIAEACPADAFRRVPADQPYLRKGQQALPA